jgi:UrcA family protein
MKTGALVLTTALIGCLAGSAQATTTADDNVMQEVVSYADLDLTNDGDAATLRKRIKAAARRVCIGHAELLIPMALKTQQQKCAEGVTARAVADVDARSIAVANARP